MKYYIDNETMQDLITLWRNLHSLSRQTSALSQEELNACCKYLSAQACDIVCNIKE